MAGDVQSGRFWKSGSHHDYPLRRWTGCAYGGRVKGAGWIFRMEHLSDSRNTLVGNDAKNRTKSFPQNSGLLVSRHQRAQEMRIASWPWTSPVQIASRLQENRTVVLLPAAVASAGNHGGFRWRLVQDPTERWEMQCCKRWKIPPCWL